MTRAIALTLVIASVAISASSQVFSSGSTGADGALDLSSGSLQLQLPESGILNLTTINVPVGAQLTFKPNLRNTPVIMLAQGNVVVAGTISVSAPLSENFDDLSSSQSIPGPGGFYGGQPGKPGFGPGGGQPVSCTERRGKWIGPLSLVPLVGGSGGAGYGQCSVNHGESNYGGGGGGAILIASSGTITIATSARIRANAAGRDALGSAGAIRLVANALNVAGTLDACFGSAGVVRLEAGNDALSFSGFSCPAAVLSEINPILRPTELPALTISSIEGFPVPQNSGRRFDTVDLLLPSQLQDPIHVVVSGMNIPVGTEVKIGFVRGSSQGTSAPGILNGSFQQSFATTTISGLSRGVGSITYLLAIAVFELPLSAQKFNSKGINRVAKVRIESSTSGESKLFFLRTNGTQIDKAKLPKGFLRQFGL